MRKWTKQEDDLVLQYASDFSDNMRKGFLVLSFKIGRSPETIVTRFYNKLNKLDNKELYIKIEECVQRGLINASNNIKKYNRSHNMYANEIEEIYISIMKEIKSNL